VKVSYSVSFARVKAGARLREAESVTPMNNWRVSSWEDHVRHIFGGVFLLP